MPLTPRQEFYDLLSRVGESRALFELGVHRTTMYRWLEGKTAIPKAALYVMRDLAYGVGVDPDWEGWRFQGGLLHSPCRERFTPGDLLAQRYLKFSLEALRRENEALKAKVAAMSTDPAVRDKAANDAAIAFVPVATPYP